MMAFTQHHANLRRLRVEVERETLGDFGLLVRDLDNSTTIVHLCGLDALFLHDLADAIDAALAPAAVKTADVKMRCPQCGWTKELSHLYENHSTCISSGISLVPVQPSDNGDITPFDSPVAVAR